MRPPTGLFPGGMPPSSNADDLTSMWRRSLLSLASASANNNKLPLPTGFDTLANLLQGPAGKDPGSNNHNSATRSSTPGMPERPSPPPMPVMPPPFDTRNPLTGVPSVNPAARPLSMMGRIPKADPMEGQLQDMLHYNMERCAGQALDTHGTSRRVRELLSSHNIGQRLFAKYVLGLSQGTVSELLSKPKMWEKLTEKGRDSYRKMHAWAYDENAVLLLKSLIPRKGELMRSASSPRSLAQIQRDKARQMHQRSPSHQPPTPPTMVPGPPVNKTTTIF